MFHLRLHCGIQDVNKNFHKTIGTLQTLIRTFMPFDLEIKSMSTF
jgi:hypothetical protein